MSGYAFVILKGLMGFGLPLAWAVRELVLLRREAAKEAPPAEAASAQTVPAVAAPEPERRLAA